MPRSAVGTNREGWVTSFLEDRTVAPMGDGGTSERGSLQVQVVGVCGGGVHIRRCQSPKVELEGREMGGVATGRDASLPIPIEGTVSGSGWGDQFRCRREPGRTETGHRVREKTVQIERNTCFRTTNTKME